MLCENGAAVDHRDKKGGKTPLYMASQEGHRGAMLALLRARASPVFPNGTSTVLHTAATFGHVDLVRDLVAPAHCTDPVAIRAFLLCATRARNVADAVAAGQQAQAAPPQRSLLHRLPVALDRTIHSFVWQRCWWTEDLDYLDAKGKTAADMAQKYGEDAVVEVLRDAGATIREMPPPEVED